MIVVTGPTGQIGAGVLDHLLTSGEPLRVVARDPSKLPAGTRGRVEVVQGSHGDPDVVDEAFTGADSVFWLLPPSPAAVSLEAAYLGFTRPAAEALTRHGVQRVVTVSALGRGTPVAARAGHVTASLAMDDLLAATGVHLRSLTAPSFMDNTARQAALIRDQGMLTSPIAGDWRMPTVATRDLAEVAARWLLDPSWTGVAEVPVLGPEDLSFEELARILTDVLGRPVRFQQVSGEAFTERLRQAGASEAVAQGQLEMALAKGAGLDAGVQRTPESATPTTFRQWCEEVLAPAVERR